MVRSETQRRRNGGNGNGAPLPFLDDIPDAMRSAFDTGAKLQSEFLTLWSHRAQAWLNWPRQMLSCKTPSDVTAAQGAFLTTMQRHYKEYIDCVVNDVMAIEANGRGRNGDTSHQSEARSGRSHESTEREAA